MALTTEQYNRIMRGYDEKRDRHRQEALLRRQDVYLHIPEYRKLEDEIRSLRIRSLENRLNEVPSGIPAAENNESGTEGPAPVLPDETAARIEELTARRDALLSQYGYPADYLEEKADCPDCLDTGYVNGRKCRCFRLQETALLCDQSRLKDLILFNNFSLLSEEYYEGQDLERFRKAAAACRQFLKDYPDTVRHLCFYGTVGTGKSFLSICVADEMLKRGCSVLYFSAVDLFDRLSSYGYDASSREAYQAFLKDLYECDLLILDDLGTEYSSQMTATRFFALLNERILRKKPMIISTNLELDELRDRYSDRVFSRMVASFDMRKLTGKDIRLLSIQHNRRK